MQKSQVAWIDVQGLADESLLSALAGIFKIHEMALDCIVNTPQRVRAKLLCFVLSLAAQSVSRLRSIHQVKTHQYENHTLYVTRMLRLPAQVFSYLLVPHLTERAAFSTLTGSVRGTPRFVRARANQHRR